jgi:hypothetical protein
MDIESLLIHSRKLIENHYKHADEIESLYVLACDEIEAGGSEPHECELAVSEMDYIVES